MRSLFADFDPGTLGGVMAAIFFGSCAIIAIVAAGVMSMLGKRDAARLTLKASLLFIALAFLGVIVNVISAIMA
jgi:hypothetical protein